MALRKTPKKSLTKKVSRLNAPAKINLFLHITGKRKDGYHNLESLFTFTEFSDELQFREAEKDSINFSGPFGKKLDKKNNTIVKALENLRSVTGFQGRVKIDVKKNIPVFAGLGGGSSDAAATLLALNELWQLKLSQKSLEKIATKIGADVPACLHKKPCFVSGIGEKIKPAKFPAYFILLVNPGKALSTAECFSLGFESFSKKIVRENLSLTKIKSFKNDLEKNSIKLIPEIREILEALSKTKGCLFSRMAGSGATCFALYKNAADLEQAYLEIKKYKKTWWVQRSKLM